MPSATDFPVHPCAKIFPLMEGEPFDEMVADIKANGLMTPITLYVDPKLGKCIIDGRNRFRACKKAKIEPRYVTIVLAKGQSLAALVWSLNVVRRQLSKSQLAAAGNELKKQLEREAKELAAAARASAKETGTKGHIPRGKGQAREKAAAATGASPRSIHDAGVIEKEAPHIYEKIRSGEINVNQGMYELRRERKAKALRDAHERHKAGKAEREKAKSGRGAAASADKSSSSSEAPAPEPETITLYEIVNDDCISALSTLAPATIQTIFADPPYNQGVDYGSGAKADKLSPEDYHKWCERWIQLSWMALRPNGAIFLVISDDWAAEFKLLLEAQKFHVRSWLIWYETFGNNMSDNFNRTHRHILYGVKNAKKYIFNPDAVNQPSARQSKYNDKRAAEGGKNWDDVITHIPRLTDTAKERMPGVPTQLPLALVRPLIELTTMPNDLVVDPFGGSGTTLEACLTALTGIRNCTIIEKQAAYTEMIEQRAALVLEGSSGGSANKEEGKASKGKAKDGKGKKAAAVAASANGDGDTLADASSENGKPAHNDPVVEGDAALPVGASEAPPVPAVH